MITWINMPRLGLTMNEGVITRWMKKVGDTVEKGEVIAEIESDKSTVPFESPESGTLLKIIAEEGAEIPIYEPIAAIGEAGEEVTEALGTSELSASGQPAPDRPASGMPDPDTSVSGPAASDAVSGRDAVPGERVFASPAARKAAAENGVDLRLVPLRQGKKRLEKADVLSWIQEHKVKSTPLAKRVAEGAGIDLAHIQPANGTRIYSSDLRGAAAEEREAAPAARRRPGGLAEDRRVPVAGMRRVIAQKMKESIETAAHVALTTEVDMSRAVDLRQRLLPFVEKRYGVRLSLNDIVIRCAAEALREFPRVNSVFQGDEIIEKSGVHVGMAVALEEGLVVPVIRDADCLSLGGIAAESKRLAQRARAGELMPDEYSGGTFTVSNLGMYDVTFFSSIINQPESAILSVAKVVDRIVPEAGVPVIRPMMNLTVNFDHRPVDGAQAAQFLRRIKQLLEEPYELLG